MCCIGNTCVLGHENSCVLQLRSSQLSWKMIQVNCNSDVVKEFAPKGILYPDGIVYYNIETVPSFVIFIYKTAKNKDVEGKPKGCKASA